MNPKSPDAPAVVVMLQAGRRRRKKTKQSGDTSRENDGDTSRENADAMVAEIFRLRSHWQWLIGTETANTKQACRNIEARIDELQARLTHYWASATDSDP